MTVVEIEELAGRVLIPRLREHGLDHVEVRVDHDDPDDPALFIEAFMKSDSALLGKGIASAAHHALSESLLEAGETRFPYFVVRYWDEAPLEEISQGSE